MNQEQIMQIQMLEQEANQLNEQLQLVEQNINEMTELSMSLKEVDEHKEGDEILANLGKKIYLPVEIKDKELIVEVGRGNLVKKSVSETLKIIDEHIKKLKQGKEQITCRVEEIQGEMIKLINILQKEQSKEK